MCLSKLSVSFVNCHLTRLRRVKCSHLSNRSLAGCLRRHSDGDRIAVEIDFTVKSHCHSAAKLSPGLCNGVLHFRCLSAHGNSGGIGARIGGCSGNSSAILGIGNVRYSHTGDKGVFQNCGLFLSVIDQITRRSLNGHTATVVFGQSAVCSRTMFRNSCTVLTDDVLPAMLVCLKLHGFAVIHQSDATVWNVSNEVFFLDPASISCLGDGDRISICRVRIGCHTDAGSFTQFPHYLNGFPISQ